MTKQNNIFSINPEVYEKKIKGLTLFFDPLTVSEIVLLEGWEKTMMSMMNGKREFSEIFNKMRRLFPSLSENKMRASISHLVDENIISRKEKRTRLGNNQKEEHIDHLSFWISLSDQCNFRCAYCFIRKDASSMEESGYKKTVSKIIELIKKNRPRFIRVNYAGGEPLLNMKMLKKLHEGLLKIGEELKVKIEETVITNGSLVTDDVINYFKKEQIQTSVSLDGLGEVNDRTRTYRDGASTFSHIQKGLLLLKKNNLLRNVDIVISSQNIHDLLPFVQFLLRSKILFVLNFYKYNIQFGNKLYCAQDELILQLKKIYKKIYTFYEENNIQKSPIEQLQLLDSVQFKEKRTRICGAGTSYFSLRIDGSMDACPLLSIGDMKKNNKTFKVVPSDEISGCKNCEWRYLCAGGCAAEKWIEHGDNSVPSHYCLVYKKLIPYLLSLEGKFILSNKIKASV